MARLIPGVMDEQTPPGERDVFNLLSAGPNDWVALHSLDLAPWNKSLRTEIDFVVVVPDTGILCVEVKSHEQISFDGNSWQPKSIVRSPFKQASDGRHTLYRRLRDLAPQFRHVPIVHLCIFPRADFHIPKILSVAQWELIDINVFRSFRSGDEFCSDLKIRMRKSIAADARIPPLEGRLSHGDIDQFVSVCVPVQTYNPDNRVVIRRREEDTERILRDQQKPVLQLAALNDRVVVTGAAGTGKTLIAMEVAMRAAESGQRVALFCFNKLVGDWVTRKVSEVSPASPRLFAGRAIRVMAEMAGIEFPENPGPDYWEEELPQQLEDRLTSPEFKDAAIFDYLVLDEAQDILARPQLWGCVRQFLKGGLDGGRFAIFGDFDHQTLSDREPMTTSLVELNHQSKPARWDLTENCRNYKIVGDTAIQLAGIRPDIYSGYLRSGGSFDNYDIKFYDCEEKQLALLRKWLRDFGDMGYRPSDITILSFRADEYCAAAKLSGPDMMLRPAWRGGSATAYSSVHAFKGMENKIIILTDVILEDTDFHRDLFYVGMTRATEFVRVLCSDDSQRTLTGWITGGGKK